MKSWTLPTRVEPIVFDGQIGVVTLRNIQLFDHIGNPQQSVDTDDNIKIAFSSNNLIGLCNGAVYSSTVRHPS